MRAITRAKLEEIRVDHGRMSKGHRKLGRSRFVLLDASLRDSLVWCRNDKERRISIISNYEQRDHETRVKREE